MTVRASLVSGVPAVTVISAVRSAVLSPYSVQVTVIVPSPLSTTVHQSESDTAAKVSILVSIATAAGCGFSAMKVSDSGAAFT